MKKRLVPVALVLAAVSATSCSKNDSNPSVPKGGLSGDTLWGQVTENITLQAGKTYFLDGPTFIKNNTTLTIQPGVVLKAFKKGTTSRSNANSFLVVTRGSKINAAGAADKPIVMTSAQPAGTRAAGDWGGLMLLGKANVNSVFEGAIGRQMEGFADDDAAGYGSDIVGGGSDDADNSGILKYLRVEFAGIALSNKANSELNSITFIGVGSGTTVDYVQTSYSGDDSFEWFGGTMNASHLIAYRGLDDDFDTDNGYNGNIQFGLAIRDKDISDWALPGDSNGFESDNDVNGTYSKPLTACVFSNMTFIGPAAINGGVGIPSTAVFNRAAHIRRNSRMSIFNSVLAGFVTGIYIDGPLSAKAATTGDSLEIKNTFVGAIGGVRGGKTGSKVATTEASFDVKTWFMTPGWGNDTARATIADLGFTSVSDIATVDARPIGSSPLLNAASFTSSAKIRNSFFKSVSYVGAFAQGDTWAQGWTNYDPKNATY